MKKKTKKTMREEIEQEDYDTLFLHAVGRGDFFKVKELAPKIDNDVTLENGFLLALDNEDEDIIDLLLLEFSPENIMHMTSMRLNKSVTTFIMSKVWPYLEDTHKAQMVEACTHHNHLKLVKHIFTLEKFPKEDLNQSLLVASHQGFFDLVKLLATRADPLHNKSEALQLTCATRRHQIVDLLLPLSNGHEALEEMQLAVARNSHCYNANDCAYLQEKMAAVSKNSLTHHLGIVELNPHVKKKTRQARKL